MTLEEEGTMVEDAGIPQDPPLISNNLESVGLPLNERILEEEDQLDDGNDFGDADGNDFGEEDIDLMDEDDLLGEDLQTEEEKCLGTDAPGIKSPITEFSKKLVGSRLDMATTSDADTKKKSLRKKKRSMRDPCDGSWEAVKCKGSSITELYIYSYPQRALISETYLRHKLSSVFPLLFLIHRQLSGYELSGSLGYLLSNLKSLTTLLLGIQDTNSNLDIDTENELDGNNIKSSNILLDADLNPRLSDYGLSQFYLTSQNLGEGYNAPEAKNPSESTPKSDVYSFGVATLLYKAKAGRSLVRWATPQLHDIDALSNIADPALHGLYPPKSLSRLADIIALCVQVEPEFRPPMSEAVEAFVRMVQRSSMKLK
ncbi:unnamed protein product, partial [Brassica oleracea]